MSLVALAVLAACAHHPDTRATYTGTIEKIEIVAGDHYSPVHGKIFPTRVQVRTATHESISIFIVDIYSPSTHGRIGDSVTFTATRTLLSQDSFQWDQLTSYTLTTLH